MGAGNNCDVAHRTLNSVVRLIVTFLGVPLGNRIGDVVSVTFTPLEVPSPGLSQNLSHVDVSPVLLMLAEFESTRAYCI